MFYMPFALFIYIHRLMDMMTQCLFLAAHLFRINSPPFPTCRQINDAHFPGHQDDLTWLLRGPSQFCFGLPRPFLPSTLLLLQFATLQTSWHTIGKSQRKKMDYITFWKGNYSHTRLWNYISCSKISISYTILHTFFIIMYW